MKPIDYVVSARMQSLGPRSHRVAAIGHEGDRLMVDEALGFQYRPNAGASMPIEAVHERKATGLPCQRCHFAPQPPGHGCVPWFATPLPMEMARKVEANGAGKLRIAIREYIAMVTERLGGKKAHAARNHLRRMCPVHTLNRRIPSSCRQ
jgi:hypothetical protein